MADKTVTLSDPEWQQLVAIVANATGYQTFQKLVMQLQAQERQEAQALRPGDGLDLDPPDVNLRRVPRA